MRLLSILCVCLLVLTFTVTGCSKDEPTASDAVESATEAAEDAASAAEDAAEDVKVPELPK